MHLKIPYSFSMAQTSQEKAPLEQTSMRQTLAKGFFNLTQHWGLSREEEANLLGWSYNEKRTLLDNMRKGKTPLPKDRDKCERVIDLLNIHKSLRVLFPYDQKAVYEWVKIPRERFGNHSALDIMFEEGKEGIIAIRQYLDYERTH